MLGRRIVIRPMAWGTQAWPRDNPASVAISGGVGRSGLKEQQAYSTATPSGIAERAKVRAFAERVLLILGESE